MALAMAASVATPIETFVEAPGPSGPLKGTMLSPPAARAPVVLIVPGSGPTDRDGNNPLGVRAATYKRLAEELAERGVATVRIDKRGMFASAAAVADPNAVTIADYVDDVDAWSSAIRQRTGASCLWLLGHSEGGLVALAAAQEVRGICGLILISTAGRPLGAVLRDQLRANPANAPVLDQALAAIDALEAGRPADTTRMHPALMPLFAPPLQPFLINLFALDPARLIALYRGPIAIVHGLRDIQVSEADARLLKKANPRAELVLLPDVNHVLKTVASDDPGENVATYADPALPLAPHVAQKISSFVLQPRE
jgi:uncharacterized protein